MPPTSHAFEKQPLLDNTSSEITNHVVKLGIPKWLALTLGNLILFLQFMSYVLNMYVMNQYSYYAYMKQTFPNASINSTGGQSKCNPNINSTEYKEQVVVQKLTSEWNIYCTLVNNLPGILFTVNLASFSDVYGRRRFFIAPLVGTFLKNALCATGVYFDFNLKWFILFYATEGCTGNWISTISVVYCYLADLTEAGKPRSFVIGLLEASIATGAIISTILSGYIIKWTDGFFYPEVTSVVPVCIGLLIVLIVLPESLPESKRHKNVSLLQNFGRIFDCYRPNFSPFAKRWVFITLLLLFVNSGFANLGRLQVETLYQLNAPFCWTSVRIGWYGSLRIGMLGIGSAVMIKLFHFFTTDEYIALTGCITTVASCVVVGLASTNFMLYLSAVMSIGSTTTMPMVRAIMSRLSPIDKQGSVFSGLAAMETLTNMAAGLGANAVYDATVAIYRGFTFFVMAGYGVIAIILSLMVIIGTRGHRKQQEETVKVNLN